MNGIEIAALVLISISLVLPVLCVIKIYRLRKFKKNAVVTNAMIRTIEKRTGIRGSVYYILAVQYGDIMGKIFTGSAVTTKKYKIGDFIPLMYLTDNPAKFKTDFGKWLPWMLAFSVVFLGLIIWFCYWLLHIEYTVSPR